MNLYYIDNSMEMALSRRNHESNEKHDGGQTVTHYTT
jgi:hypothetical protein